MRQTSSPFFVIQDVFLRVLVLSFSEFRFMGLPSILGLAFCATSRYVFSRSSMSHCHICPLFYNSASGMIV